MNQLDLFGHVPTSAPPVEATPPAEPITIYTFRTVCQVCGKGMSFSGPHLVMTPEQMLEKGWIETTPNVWDAPIESCSRQCERIANGEKIRRKSTKK